MSVAWKAMLCLEIYTFYVQKTHREVLEMASDNPPSGFAESMSATWTVLPLIALVADKADLY